MNELAEVQFQMPNTITDLVKWDAFYKARQAVYKQLLKNIKAWDEATDEEKRILKRAQDEAENLIDIHAVMGEMYKNLPEEAGRPSKIESTTGRNLTLRQEFKERTGLSDSKAKRLTAISDHPDIVNEVKSEARDNNEIPTDTAILKRIEQVRKEERDKIQSEMRDLKEERDYLKYQLEEAENKEPEVKEVIKEVVPDDYDELKRKAEMADIHKKDFVAMRKAYEEMATKWKASEREKEKLLKKSREPEAEQAENLKRSALFFCAGVSNFIEKYGGYVWLTEHINEMEPTERKGYLSAINAVDSWVLAIKQNMEGGVIE